MGGKIKNRQELLSLGDKASRKTVLDIAEGILARLDGYMRVKELVSLSGDMLKVGERTWDLSKKKNIYARGRRQGMQCYGYGH